jgi:hypothetical protein
MKLTEKSGLRKTKKKAIYRISLLQAPFAYMNSRLIKSLLK